MSASKGTTVYLPYPEGLTAENAEELNVQVVHYKDLHREYGISGQAEVEEAIANCELETVEAKFDANGIVIEVPREGFSPFAVVWQTDAHAITATAGEGGTIDPAGSVIVAEGTSQTFTITPETNYVIDTVTVDNQVLDAAEYADGTYTFANVIGDHTIDVTFRSTLHTVTAMAGEGGTITPSGAQTVHEGDDIAFTVTPDEGYVVADVKVDGASVGKVDSYTFSNVTADHTIEVAFEKEAVTPPAHEHVWSDWKCDGESHWKVCEACGAISEKGAHAYGEWQQVSEATETEKGQWERVCSVCGYVQRGETPVVEPDGSEIPETGDHTSVVLPAALAVAGVAIVAGTVILRRRDSR